MVLGNTLTALAVVRDAHNQGLDPILVDKAWGIACHTRTARWELLNDANTEASQVDSLCELGANRENYLIATGDSWLRFIVRNRSALDAAFKHVLHARNEILEICLNKIRFAQWCREHDVPAPRAWFPLSEARPRALGLPLFLRPADTLHDRPLAGIPKALQVTTERELQRWLSHYRDANIEPLVTESLLGQPLIQYSVAAARTGDQMISFVAQKVRPSADACSVGTYVRLASEPTIEASVRGALEKLDYFGIAEVEVLFAPRSGRHVLIEINARPWLQYALAPASGHDFLGLLLKRTSNKKARRANMAWLNWHDDLYACWSRSVGLVRKGDVAVLEYIRSILTATTYPVFSIKDPEPALARFWPFGGRGRKRAYLAKGSQNY